MPDSYTITPEGVLLQADGIHLVQRWDGLLPDSEYAGVEAPTSTPVVVGAGTGTLTGTYYIYLRYVDRDGNVSNLSPISTPVTVDEAATLNYSNLQTTTDPKVVRRQVLRNTSGQTAVFYVDVDDALMIGSTLSSTKQDGDLAAGEAVTLFHTDGRPLANAHYLPPDIKPFLAQHQDRIFLGGQLAYTQGSVAISQGSLTVQGQGTNWPSNFAGRFLYVDGASTPFEISSVSVSNQTLSLPEEWEDATVTQARYAILPAPAERRLIWYSGPGTPESWSPADVLFVPEDSDEITGLWSLDSWLHIAERRHIYRCTFKDDPGLDGAIFLAANRGLINHRCVVEVEGTAYLLDEAGIHTYNSESSEPISQAIQDLFSPGPGLERSPGRDLLRIRWEFSEQFHASFAPAEGVIRWFVCLTGSPLPQHAICYELRRKAWWLEEYPWMVGASCQAVIEGVRSVVGGGPPGRVCVLGPGCLDGAGPFAGNLQGTVSSSTPLTLSDSGATFTEALVGCPVVLLDGVGKRQIRRISQVTSTQLTLQTPWRIRPSVGDTYQLGGVPWRYATGWYRWSDAEGEQPRYLELVHEPCQERTTLDARIYRDRAATPLTSGSTFTRSVSAGFTTEKGEPDLVADLSRETGFALTRFDRQRELYLDGFRFVALELRGVTGRVPILLYSLTLGGAN